MIDRRVVARILWAASVCVVVILGVAASARADADDSITIENYADSDVLHYPFALVKGRVAGVDVGVVVVENLSSSSELRVSRAKVARGRFKVLVELKPGRNDLIVSVGDRVLPLTLVYRKSANSHFVRVVWFVGADDADGSTPAPSGDLVRKLRVATRLWQTATGERLFDLGYGRRSFTLEANEDDSVVVWKLHGRRRAEEYLAMTPERRFAEIYRETRESSLGARNACYFVCVALGADALDDETRIALGTDEVAMLDLSRAESWPERFDQLEEFLLDASPVAEEYSRDSAFRKTKWALVSSTLGAGLHELGHAFGLRHSKDPNDFMSRGFDKFNRIFTVYEPASALAPASYFDEQDVATWGRESVERLLRSKWIEE